ncbi:hypothetical protein CONPUDRAFT_68760 [Coniophora puteana RWD-64-598 SS2]|uniref:DUF6533 domain-containing protein n=1 Tax=Coniophora puteana (strain RWD-64-598) TaxID=741705 RepID=A0A5M3N4D9_CONPW|nr:uncharacterized protein CONPUDRAFT_68760 [Coniophora puteana RWD-64-598 SS2]EIW86166.1 hypothetical protein CONPUDRAFT_68760 [Coniophora puteana RWD-64-598 SS2]
MDTFSTDAYGKQSDAYANLSGLALLAFDYLITLDEEVTWVWGKKWDISRCVFTLARYVPFSGLVLTVWAALRAAALQPCNATQNGTACNQHNFCRSLIVWLCAIDLSGLVFMRLWAFWGCNRLLLVSMLTAAIVFSATAVYLTYSYNNVFPREDLWPNICNFTDSKSSAIEYGFLAAYEIILLVLILYRWFRHFRATNSRIAYILYRDTTIYLAFMIKLQRIASSGIPRKHCQQGHQCESQFTNHHTQYHLRADLLSPEKSERC